MKEEIASLKEVFGEEQAVEAQFSAHVIAGLTP
jgi:hypothetical protein